MLNINEFKSAVHKNDLERPNLYAVNISIPKAVRDSSVYSTMAGKIDNGKLLTLFCKGANLPGVSLNLAAVQRYGIGPSVKMPVGGVLNDINLTFMNDASGWVYGFFSLWMNKIYYQRGQGTIDNLPGIENTYELGFKQEYQTDMTLTTYKSEPGKFNGSGILQTVASVASAAAGVPFIGALLGGRSTQQFNLTPAKVYQFVKLYPTNISDLSYSYDSSNVISEFTVGFTYQTFGTTINL